MAKKKVGKQRKDKFYQLAKETGYRSRAAFKLIQLNRKYEFLAKSRVLVDLCAAPGGWMQVASQFMPVSSLIIGVDLFPIKPIPRTVSIQADITTEACRQKLRKELQTWKADVVLNDGAPNVGRNWLHDAFKQNELVLSALKLSAEILNKGGWFVTKAFRSKDYTKLLSVAGKLFDRVHATKPRASRSESAEIFVVCQGFLGAEKLGPDVFDPKVVFKDETTVTKQKLDLTKPEGRKAKKPKAEGYPEDQPYVIYSRVPVLGRAEFRTLLNWRKKLRLEKEKQRKEAEAADAPQEEPKEESEDEEEKLKKEIESLREEERKAAKRKLKHLRKVKREHQKKLDAKIVLTNEEAEWDMEVDAELFKISALRLRRDADNLAEIDVDKAADELRDSDDPSSSDEEGVYVPKSNRVRVPANQLDERYLSEHRSDESEDDDGSDVDEGLGIEKSEDSEDEVDLPEDEDDLERNPMLVDLMPGSKEEKRKRKADDWFSRLIDFQVDTSERVRATEELSLLDSLVARPEAAKKTKNLADATQKAVEKYGFEEVPVQPLPGVDDEESSDGDDDDDEDEKKSLSRKSKKRKNRQMEKENGEPEIDEPVKKKKKIPKLDANGMAIGTMLIKSAKARRDLMDASWNRYSFHETEGLPEWFVQDEEKHMRRPVQPPREVVEEYKQKLKEIDARPIKKVVEAKARKKRRAKLRLDKARKKAENVTENSDMTDREKNSTIKQIYRKALTENTKKKEVKYVVSRRFLAKKGIRPPGMKGPYKVVDPRMKKDNRAQKKVERRQWNRAKARQRK
ncbi:unnamed protein product [Notodromas monacha]|uniref:Putative rRNA methyltransferase n=1 Tax=Notodromas monacha TaxID=399045 RepID=A0A7R9BTC5_9CRUS|nr:unnamed protein product [Notodromas monacha]CAG0921384.1 unnamed protein product [Notodromas monacha]